MDSYDGVKLDTELFSIQFSTKVNNTWQDYRQVKAFAPEAFGVLIGSKYLGVEIYDIAEITIPQKGDRCSRTSFTLRDPEHQSCVDRLYYTSGGELIYLGTWHTHPEKNPYASNIDIKDWKECKARNKDRRLFFVIIGTEKKALYYFDQETLLRQEF
ncbi:Mov34/MPN/PAD-1 family protein [Dickeya zeae]|uniref:Mov34/MPN/PAD-1 family protein n=1 Tax=Dickeya zeae TaxID=204042 RepID=UPI00035CF089|nr:hypothetical protein J417_04635 [Dickeya zeae MS1]